MRTAAYILLDDTFLGEPGVELQLGLDILLIECNKALESHVDICLLLHQEFPFPRLCFPLGGKSPFELLLSLATPVGVAELHIPCAIVLVFKCCHQFTVLSF